METKKIAIIILIILALGAGGYYLLSKNNNPAGYPFGPEVIPTATPPISNSSDSDKDGLSDAIEKVLGTNINNADTDGDTYNDLAEIKNGYDPLAAGSTKLSAEEWQILKDKIKAVDKDFYEKEFEVTSMNFIYPDDYKLKSDEIPVGFRYKPIDDEDRAVGFSANPGFFSKDNIGELIYALSPAIDLARVKDVYVSTLVETTKQSEIGFVVVRFNYDLSGDFVQEMKKIIPREGYIYLKDDKNILIIIGGSVNSISSVEIKDIANKLQSRLGLIRIEINKVIEDASKVNMYDNVRKTALNDISNALKIYAEDNSNKYPISNENTMLNDDSVIRKDLLGYTSVRTDFKDPKYPEFYYIYKSNGSSFELSARLENLDDEECYISYDICVYKIIDGKIVSHK